jgi:hypothetical protein
MKALTDAKKSDMAKALGGTMLCPHNIVSENDAMCIKEDWTTPCEICWQKALDRVRILDEGEDG